jgi:hypothetical protein
MTLRKITTATLSVCSCCNRCLCQQSNWNFRSLQCCYQWYLRDVRKGGAALLPGRRAAWPQGVSGSIIGCQEHCSIGAPLQHPSTSNNSVIRQKLATSAELTIDDASPRVVSQGPTVLLSPHKCLSMLGVVQPASDQPCSRGTGSPHPQLSTLCWQQQLFATHSSTSVLLCAPPQLRKLAAATCSWAALVWVAGADLTAATQELAGNCWMTLTECRQIDNRQHVHSRSKATWPIKCATVVLCALLMHTCSRLALIIGNVPLTMSQCSSPPALHLGSYDAVMPHPAHAPAAPAPPTAVSSAAGAILPFPDHRPAGRVPLQAPQALLKLATEAHAAPGCQSQPQLLTQSCDTHLAPPGMKFNLLDGQ